MKSLFRLILFSSALASTSGHAADDYVRYQNRYKLSDSARRAFGDPSPYRSTPGMEFGSVYADLSTRMDCGKIDVVTNFEAQFKKIRDQLKGFLTDIDGYVAAAPMVTLCYTMPQVCALIRHDHFQFAQNLNLRAQACAAIDKFIDNQAEKGAKQLQAEAKRNCVEGRLRQGRDMASATSDCEDTTGMPLRDISSGLKKQFRNGPQRALESMLRHVNESQSYEFLAAVLGEIEIQPDGYWQPLWPRRMIKPDEAAKNYIARSVNMVCQNLSSVLSGGSNGNSEYERNVARVMREHLSQQDLSDLEDLFDNDRKVACFALGRSIGVLAAKQSVSKNNAVMSASLTNAALPAALRDEYRARSTQAFQALRDAIEAEEAPSLTEVKNNIRELAAFMRKYNRGSAARLSNSKTTNESHRRDERTDCYDTASCR